MRRYVIALIFLLGGTVAPCALAAKAESQAVDETSQHALAKYYAELVGKLALVDWLFASMSDVCDMEVGLPGESYSDIDYALRLQTNVSFFQWRKQFSDPAQEAKLVKQLVSSTLNDIGGCEEEAVNQWFKGMQQNMLEPTIAKLKELPELMGLTMNAPSDDQLAKVFAHQLAKADELSLDELRGLAGALQSGLYRYSMLVFSDNVVKNLPAAVSLREKIYARSQQVSDLYELANSTRRVDKDKAITLFNEAAEKGSFRAQRWWGNYLACNGQSQQALHWLQQARATKPDEADFINDFIAEINELGEPTNCIDGWPE
ncbi:hypothetical protein [Alteromonas lipolytica]|uniref:Uncharacterized protein n=1 Tax=Alteromonas lipolytica TaxID=1856405 RepID=A0A1E8FBX4_9ALTE|nr:hypothetical protein [Alteromonas lipolytica]OFI33410.1 hypothetical protein BFC17_03885 [Alteromonas lipolytica]GGF59947.1 hypothetical protein GCM10011338_10230 [Alteromonas lipolytica]